MSDDLARITEADLRAAEISLVAELFEENKQLRAAGEDLRSWVEVALRYHHNDDDGLHASDSEECDTGACPEMRKSVARWREVAGDDTR